MFVLVTKSLVHTILLLVCLTTLSDSSGTDDEDVGGPVRDQPRPRWTYSPLSHVLYSTLSIQTSSSNCSWETHHVTPVLGPLVSVVPTSVRNLLLSSNPLHRPLHDYPERPPTLRPHPSLYLGRFTTQGFRRRVVLGLVVAGGPRAENPIEERATTSVDEGRSRERSVVATRVDHGKQ